MGSGAGARRPVRRSGSRSASCCRWMRCVSLPIPPFHAAADAGTDRATGPRQRCFELAAPSAGVRNGSASRAVAVDVSERQELTLALEEARATRDLALIVLRTDAIAMRTLRDRALSAVATIRSTLRLPARTQEALQGKADTHAARGRRTGRPGAGAVPGRAGSCLRGTDQRTGRPAAEGSTQWR